MRHRKRQRYCLFIGMSSKNEVKKKTTHERGLTQLIIMGQPIRLILTDLLAFAIDFWMLPRYIPEHFGIFPKFNDGRR